MRLAATAAFGCEELTKLLKRAECDTDVRGYLTSMIVQKRSLAAQALHDLAARIVRSVCTKASAMNPGF